MVQIKHLIHVWLNCQPQSFGQINPEMSCFKVAQKLNSIRSSFYFINNKDAHIEDFNWLSPSAFEGTMPDLM